jgi:phosphoglycerol transferase MdoB-like AlkP superfamily enzyme
MNRKSKGGLKEMLRKTIVSLKRKPQTIPMLVLAVAFLYYSLNLTHVSDTTAKIQSQGMGLSGFCTMLFSMLSFVCFINAYPHRKKTNIPMLVLMFIMVAGLIFCDTYYMGFISRAITRPDHPIVVEEGTRYIQQAFDMLGVHRIILIVGFVLTLLVPVLRKLLRKIDTSLPVEECSQMNGLHLSQED